MDKARLVDDINLEIRNLERLNEEMNELLTKIKEEPNFIEIRASASIIQDFYSGIEKIFERIALFMDKKLPNGENWHSELLSQIKEPVPHIRPAIISEDLYKKLKKYLDYRHLYRHIYGFELKWERFRSLVFSMSTILEEFKENIKEFIDFIESRKWEGHKK